MEEAKALIVQAIRRGAPLYNAGQPQACHQLYKDTASLIIQKGLGGPYVSKPLSEAVARSLVQPGPSDAAWVMRNCFDSILDGRVEAEARAAGALGRTSDPSSGVAQAEQVPDGVQDVSILDFEASLPSVPSWFSMDDVVMGGASSSKLVWDESTRSALFQGTVSTAYNGGFASVRSEIWAGYQKGLHRAKGVRLLVSGDGRTYKLSAKADDGFDGVMYQHDFATVDDGRWRSVDLPFTEFRANFRGRVVPGAPALSGAQVRQLGLMVSKFSDAGGMTSGFRAGQFRLAVKSIRGILL